MMNDPNQVINAQALAIVPAKRKRGRPRKYPVLDDPNSYLGDQSPSNGGDEFHVPPGYRGANGNKSRHADPNDSMTGQAVSGFLEAEFDGGYLLTVRVRNSDTVLRGVVFKPGRFVPVSAENDVAPNAHMVKRNDSPFQKVNYGRAHGGSRSRSKERNGVAYPSGSLSACSTALKSKLMSPAPLQAVSSIPLRGNVVPVVLQPITSTNNGALTHNLSPPLSKETQPVALQVVHPDTQSTPSEKQAPKASERTPRDQRNEEAEYEVETKPVIPPPGMSFENLVTEVIKRTQTQTPPQADNAENSQAVEKSSTVPEEGVATGGQPPAFVEPSQVVQPIPMDLSPLVPRPLESERAGKMTELLQAVQENAMKNQMPEP